MNIIGKIKNNKFSLNVLLLMAGTVLSQAIPVLVSPVLTRLFTPEDFGLFALYFSITMVICVFITGRYELAIILPSSDKDAIDLIALCFIITAVITVLLFAIFWGFGEPISEIFGNPAINKVLLYVPFGVFFIGVLQPLNYWFNRRELYKQLSISRVSRSLGTVTFSIFLGFFKIGKSGLIIGDLIGQGLNSITLFFRTLRDKPRLFSEVSSEGIKRNLVRYKQFPLMNVPSGLLDKMSGQMPVFILTAFFNSSVAGLFALSQRVISAPSSIISRSMGDVFRQQASVEYVRDGNCKKSFLRLFFILSLIGIIPFTIFFFTAPLIFNFVFGSEWVEAGEYSRIMTIMFFLQFVSSPLGNMFLIAEKQFLDLMIQLFIFSLLLTSLLFGKNFISDPRVLIKLFTVCYSIKYCIELYLSYRFSLGNLNIPTKKS